MNYPYPKTTSNLLEAIQSKPGYGYLFFGDDDYGIKLAIRIILKKLFEVSNINPLQKRFSNSYLKIRAENNKLITIGQIRQLNNQLSHSFSSKYRVVVIERIDQCSKDAANALLKNLEESKKDTIFILTASSLDMVLPTIISRVQVVNFPVPIISELEKYMSVEYKIDITKAKELLNLAHGSLKVAIDLINQESYDDYVQIISRTKEFIKGSITERFYIANQISSNKQTEFFLKNLIYTLRNQSTILNQVKDLELLLGSMRLITVNINSRLLLENIALKLTRREN